MANTDDELNDSFASSRASLTLCSVFVGELPIDVSEAELNELFASFEPVQCIVKRAKGTRVPLGYGFVEFRTEAEAEAVVNLPKVLLRGKEIRVSWAHRNCTLHIKNILASITEGDLNDAFKVFGELYENETVVIRPGTSLLSLISYSFYNADHCMSVDGRVLVFGRVHFKRREDAETAMKQMNGADLLDNKIPLIVEWYQPPHSRRNSFNASAPVYGLGLNSAPIVSIYVQFQATKPTLPVTEDGMREVFSRFGLVTSVYIKNVTPSADIETGYAFVHFEVFLSTLALKVQLPLLSIKLRPLKMVAKLGGKPCGLLR